MLLALPVSAPPMSTAPDPLTPAQIDALLHAHPSTSSAADLLALRDALRRLSEAWERVAVAANGMARAAAALDRHAQRLARRGDVERPRGAPPRGD